jgi:hypothetical protein
MTLPYLLDMARKPATFEIRSVTVTPGPRAAMVRYGPTGALPSSFAAVVDVHTPDLLVTLSIVYIGHQPRVTGLVVEVDPRRTITTSLLRQVLIDPMLHAAIAAALQPLEEHPEVQEGAYRVAGDEEGTYRVSRARRRGTPGSDEQARQAAEIYKTAIAMGSGSPTLDVAKEMSYGRSQASRLIRAARNAGYLPAVNPTKGDPQ